MAPLLPTPACERKRRQYIKIRNLGKGTFGVVDLVRDVHTGATFVMKTVSLRGACIAGRGDKEHFARD